MTFDFNVNLGTVLTVAFTQAVSTIATFYMLKFLNGVHSSPKIKNLHDKVKGAVEKLDSK